jgi:hypothetical protein
VAGRGRAPARSPDLHRGRWDQPRRHRGGHHGQDERSGETLVEPALAEPAVEQAVLADVNPGAAVAVAAVVGEALAQVVRPVRPRLHPQPTASIATATPAAVTILHARTGRLPALRSTSHIPSGTNASAVTHEVGDEKTNDPPSGEDPLRRSDIRHLPCHSDDSSSGVGEWGIPPCA